jgi:hypothetical protein
LTSIRNDYAVRILESFFNVLYLGIIIRILCFCTCAIDSRWVNLLRGELAVIPLQYAIVVCSFVEFSLSAQIWLKKKTLPADS